MPLFGIESKIPIYRKQLLDRYIVIRNQIKSLSKIIEVMKKNLYNSLINFNLFRIYWEKESKWMLNIKYFDYLYT